jgi:hypothetical protein
MNYINEIDIYCGLNRRDATALEFLASEFRRLSEELAKLVAPLAWVEPLENLKLPPLVSRADFADSITRQLTQPNLPAEKRDALLDSGEGCVNVKPELKRAEVQGLVAHWVMSLRAYTVALKNLEGIPHKSKEQHLRAVLEGWATLVRYACLLFETLLGDEQVVVGPLKFQLNLPREVKSTVLRILFINIPLLISLLLRKDLGSQKLAVQLKKNELATSMTVEFLQTGLYADMKLPEYLSQLVKLHRRVQSSKFLLEALLVKLQDIYIRFDVGPTEQERFRKLVLEIGADSKGLKGAARDKYLKTHAEQLDKSTLLARIRSEQS